MSGAIATINCTSCGAGLDVLGGGRVLAQACGYCGAVLDAQDNYKVLAKYEGVARPASPLRLGMSGKIDGVGFTVIGTLGLEERWNGRTWAWAEHQVFSPTHGYGWLSVEDGHLLWTRKQRRKPTPTWITTITVEHSDNRPKATLDGETYTYYETSTARITFIEGEFNWVPEMGARSVAVSLLGPGAMLSFVSGKGENEIELTRCLPHETFAGFGVRDAVAPRGVHPTQPYVAGPNEGFQRRVGIIGAFVSLVLMVALFGMSGPVQRLSPDGGASFATAFEVADASRPTRISLETRLRNNWHYYEISVSDPDGTVLFETGRQVSYYYGGRGEDAWREGAQSASLTFQPTKVGTYRLDIALAEGNRPQDGITRIEVQSGRPAVRWLTLTFVAFLLMTGLAYARRAAHSKRRWSGSDWSDEDD